MAPRRARVSFDGLEPRRLFSIVNVANFGAVPNDGAEAVAARLRANGQEAYSIGLAGTPGFLAGRMLVMGAIDPGDFERLFARARAES